MAVMNIREAIVSTLHSEMERDPDIMLLGEDVVGGNGTAGGPEAIGGIWGTSPGLWAKFGPDRVIDTPISESAMPSIPVRSRRSIRLLPAASVYFVNCRSNTAGVSVAPAAGYAWCSVW